MQFGGWTHCANGFNLERQAAGTHSGRRSWYVWKEPLQSPGSCPMSTSERYILGVEYFCEFIRQIRRRKSWLELAFGRSILGEVGASRRRAPGSIQTPIVNCKRRSSLSNLILPTCPRAEPSAVRAFPQVRRRSSPADCTSRSFTA
jgi:hypothetical protein